MNQRPQGLKVEKAMAGFLQYKSAEGLAPVTVTGIDVGKITSQHILSFLNYMRTDYAPRRIAGDNSIKLPPKTVYDIYVSPASFLHGLVANLNCQSHEGYSATIVPEDALVEPYNKEEIELLIKACDLCEEAGTARRHSFIMQRSTGIRGKAILLTLLDTGLRASELCALHNADVDMETGKVVTRSGEAGKAKGSMTYESGPMASLGKRYGVSVLGMESIIKLGSIIHRTDYWRRGKTVEKLGLEQWSVSELTRFVQEGVIE